MITTLRLALATLAVLWGSALAATQSNKSPDDLTVAESRAPRLVFATYAATFRQARNAEVLIDSIRSFAGAYSQAPIYVLVDESKSKLPLEVSHAGVHVLPLEMDQVARGFLFAEKVYAAAQVEALIASEADTLLWMDPETVVVQAPRALDLADDIAVAMRPVFLVNTIGLAPEQPLDGFWSAIYRETGVQDSTVPTVEAFVPGTPIRLYVNCGIIAYRPSKGICREWARAFSAMLRDEVFRQAHCADVLHRIFLHQAVLSAVIVARSHPAEWRWLPDDHGYPLGQHEQLPEEKKAARLNDLSCFIYDTLWANRSDWMTLIAIDEPLRSWLSQAHWRSLQLADRLYSEERSCNTYLVRTAAGDVVIDPGGAEDPVGWMERERGSVPLRAILLTHGHADHRGAVARWKGSLEIPVVGHNEHGDVLADADRIAPFLARRNAIIAGKPLPVGTPQAVETPVELTQLFDERFSLEVGGIHFEMIHTPGETPDTSTVWIPELAAVLLADNFYAAFPNLSTLRGNKPRWALEYAAAMEQALALEPALLLPGHGEPIMGKEKVRATLTRYRDAILHVHDAVVAGINDGKDVFTLMREVTLPEQLTLPQFFGRVPWAVRGTYEGYVGWFDGNPSSMYDQPAASVYPELAELAGGPDAIVAKAKVLLEGGEEVRALHLIDVALAAIPAHRGALEARMAVLQALRRASRNYFEMRFLDHAIGETRDRLTAAGAAAR